MYLPTKQLGQKYFPSMYLTTVDAVVLPNEQSIVGRGGTCTTRHPT